MRIAYLNAKYKAGLATGGSAHIHQFVSCAAALGHEIWMDASAAHPKAHRFPQGRVGFLRSVRSMDIVYARVEWSPPPQAHWCRRPYRALLGAVPMVWEFNTVPEYGRLLGRSEEEIRRAIAEFQMCASGCALAICVTDELAGYVRDTLGIAHVVTIPNGSDPAMFCPEAVPVRRVRDLGKALHVAWMGSAHLSWHHLDLLREAAAGLWAQGDGNNVVFHLMGEGIRGMRDMPPNVHYHGSVPYEELPNWLCRMDVGLVLYRDGPAMMGSPLKLFDYLASGLVVVANEHPQVRSVLSEIDQADLILKQNDANALAALLLDLHGKRAWMKQQGARGRELISSKYNWNDLVRSVIRAVEAL